MSTKTIKTINPYNGNILESYKQFSDDKVESYLSLANQTFEEWKTTEISERITLFKQLADTLIKNKQLYSELMTKEMGKPISQSMAEIEKCALLTDFYITNADDFLADELIETDASESFISYDPLGCILGIMPWNYPFWQVLRFAIPTITAGNTVLLKHAANVTGSALAIQDLFEESGFPKGCFQTLIVDHDQIESIIADNRIQAVSLTGSEKAGKHIAQVAGKNLKKTVLELGGNNACIVLADADLDSYLDTMVNARMQNTGQSCIAAKRFIVEAAIYDEFLEKFKNKVMSIEIGDPLKEATGLSVLAREDLAKTLKDQVDKSVKKGAKILIGNKSDKAFFEPTIITDVTPGMPVFDEETFGPVAAIIKVKDAEEAYKLATNSRFGLGSMVFTKDTETAKHQINRIPDGAFFINDMVKSDPRLPFGGTKASGFGRELSVEGIHEFVNKKTIYINL
ncbi:MULTISPECIES: NAD-dependent succinate-semialdehyde dehydrogenase [Bizionia]|uniref:NAD-dependent succinate-semialdehyde dehydrogenase n=1 Tax=Bizionia algoritergicola TaxID=291187 RepID=A0A5D0QRA8_9FLAO|nr:MULTISPECIES: NAD-dependent succinate-semialdehyde dehydrogenase [Bizionia]OBX21132.1 succinate-semialdehyde dehydrogenase [Bizionia sp. APA-3]TYB71732.1 NAD-dependent succinate-semialdehyde dehydrogenase [Bizionia algoritergicola]